MKQTLQFIIDNRILIAGVYALMNVVLFYFGYRYWKKRPYDKTERWFWTDWFITVEIPFQMATIFVNKNHPRRELVQMPFEIMFYLLGAFACIVCMLLGGLEKRKVQRITAAALANVPVQK